ncbi:hypothetical protein [Vibrio parahaemolyticus]|nr:hypothetical protein [Vibrio parahaemolyticus]
MVGFAGVKCGKNMFIGSSSSLVVLRVEFLEAKAESCAGIHH